MSPSKVNLGRAVQLCLIFSSIALATGLKASHTPLASTNASMHVCRPKIQNKFALISMQVGLDIGAPDVVGLEPSKRAVPVFDLNITDCLNPQKASSDVLTVQENNIRALGYSSNAVGSLPCSNTSHTLLSRSKRVTVLVKLTDPVLSFSKGALDVDNGEVISIPVEPYRLNNLTVYEVVVELAPPGTITSIRIAENTLFDATTGAGNEASNLLDVIYDNQSPKPKITSLRRPDQRQLPAPAVLVDFGERVLGDPREIVNVTYHLSQGQQAPKMHMLYDALYGKLYMVWETKDSIAAKISVPQGITTDLVGNPTLGASLEMAYSDNNPDATALGTGLVSLWGIGSVFTAAGAIMKVVPGMALVRSFHQAQTFYWLSRLPSPSMPSNVQDAASLFEFVTLNFGLSSDGQPSFGNGQLSEGDLMVQKLMMGGVQLPKDLSLVTVDSSGGVSIAGPQQAADLLSPTPLPGVIPNGNGLGDVLSALANASTPGMLPVLPLNSLCASAAQCPPQAVCTSEFASDGLARCRTTEWIVATAAARGVIPGAPSNFQPAKKRTETIVTAEPQRYSVDQQQQQQQIIEPEPVVEASPAPVKKSSTPKIAVVLDAPPTIAEATPSPSPSKNTIAPVEATAPTPTTAASPPKVASAPSPASNSTTNGPSSSPAVSPSPAVVDVSPAPAPSSVNGTSPAPAPKGPPPKVETPSSPAPSPIVAPESLCTDPETPYYKNKKFLGCAFCDVGYEPQFVGNTGTYTCVAVPVGRRLSSLRGGGFDALIEDAAENENARPLESAETMRLLHAHPTTFFSQRRGLLSADTTSSKHDETHAYIVVTITSSSGMGMAQAAASSTAATAAGGGADGLSNSANASAVEVASSIEGIVKALYSKLDYDDSDVSLTPFATAIFWCFIIMLLVFILHVALRAIFLSQSTRDMPPGLMYPFPELMTFFCLLLLFVAVASAYLGTNTAAVTLGVFFGVAFAISTIVVAVYMVLHYVGLRAPDDRSAEFVVGQAQNMALEVEARRQSFGIYYSTLDRYNRAEVDLQAELFAQREWPELTWWERWVLLPIFGYKPKQAGEWRDNNIFSHSFLARWGLLFADCKGSPVLHVPGTYQMNYRTRMLDRGKMLPLTLGRRDQAYEVAQVLGNVISISKMLLYSIVLAACSVSSSSALVAVSILFVFTFLYIVYVRWVSPFNSKADLVFELFAATCQLVTLVCCFIFLSFNPSQQDAINSTGAAILFFQTVVLLAEIVYRSKDTCMTVFWAIKRRIDAKNGSQPHSKTAEDTMADAAFNVMMHDPYILARKFCDRWLVRTLKRGLHRRRLFAHELGYNLLPRISCSPSSTDGHPSKSITSTPSSPGLARHSSKHFGSLTRAFSSSKSSRNSPSHTRSPSDNVSSEHGSLRSSPSRTGTLQTNRVLMNQFLYPTLPNT